MKNSIRQRIRLSIILTSFVLFPITIFYMSPAQSVMAALGGVINISLMFFALQFISAIIVGRAFCGWLCPGSGLTDICLSINNNIVNRRYNWIKYILWTPWILSIVIFSFKNFGQQSIDLFFGMHHKVSILSKHGLFVYLIFTFVIIIMSIVLGRHSFCHHLCWMSPFMIFGRKISNKLNLPSLRIAINSSECNSCNICNSVCPMSIDVQNLVNMNTKLEDSDCTQCGRCVDVCKRNVLSYSFSKFKKP